MSGASNEDESEDNVLSRSNALMKAIMSTIHAEMRAGRANAEVAYNALNSALALLAIEVGAEEVYAKSNLGKAYRALRAAIRKAGGP